MGNPLVIVVRFALYADLMVLAGTVAFSLYALTSAERTADILSLRRLAVGLSLTGLGLSGFGMAALVAAMTGSSVWELDGEVLREIIGESAIGTAWIVRMAAMIIAVLAASALNRRPTAARWVLLASSALAITTLVWTGHAGATEGWTGTVHRLSDVIHMLAAGLWIGGLVGLAALLNKPQPSTDHLEVSVRVLKQFSIVGSLLVVSIASTGMINSLILLDISNWYLIVETGYGRLFLAKLALFAGMLVLAARNRWFLTPALAFEADSSGERRVLVALRKSLTIEFVFAVLILALVAQLGSGLTDHSQKSTVAASARAEK